VPLMVALAEKTGFNNNCSTGIKSTGTYINNQ
jgi:phosphotriesterase-related protein